MRIIIKTLAILVGVIIIYEAIHLIWLRDMDGWAVLSWMEEVTENGPSTSAAPEDVGSFEQVKSFNGKNPCPWSIS